MQNINKVYKMLLVGKTIFFPFFYVTQSKRWKDENNINNNKATTITNNYTWVA